MVVVHLLVEPSPPPDQLTVPFIWQVCVSENENALD